MLGLAGVAPDGEFTGYDAGKLYDQQGYAGGAQLRGIALAAAMEDAGCGRVRPGQGVAAGRRVQQVSPWRVAVVG